MVSIGTLTAFIVVSLGVIILRYRQPDLPRGFKVPFFPVTPILSIVACGYILANLHWYTWLVFALWVGVFIVFYLLYGRKHSVLGRMLAGEDVDAEEPMTRGGSLMTVCSSGTCRTRAGVARWTSGCSWRTHWGPRSAWSPWCRASGRRRRWPGSTPSTPQFAQQLGKQAEAKARDYLVDPSVDVPIDYHAVTGRSVTSALLQAAQECQASVLVLGSSTDGAVGRIVVGSTTDKLLHSSPVPLALSPRGYRSTAADGFSRVTCAFSDGEESEKVVAHAVAFARSLGTPARVASFGVRGATMYPPEVGLSAEDSVLDSWREQASHAQSRLRIDEVIDEDTETVIATGAGWGESMSSVDWEPNELLVLGSSTLGPIARVFLGSRATKLIRHSPVPVLVVPRGYERPVTD